MPIVAHDRRTTTPPSNTLDTNGTTPGRNTQGILQPAPTIATATHLIGRESRRHGTGRGILEAPDIKTHLKRTDPEAVVALIRKHHHSDPGAAKRIADLTGLHKKTVRRILEGRPPSQRTLNRLWEYAYQQSLFDSE